MSIKIILSRKGFDSSAGGKPSIGVGNKIISFPIPQAHTGVFYKDLLSDLDSSYDKIFRDLQITQYSEAHLDPDLYKNVFNNLHKKERHADWKGIFGQDGAAQSHLENKGVDVGDIFLFFGWYKTAIENKKTGVIGYTKYKEFEEGFHMLYGFLEVGKKIKVGSSEIPHWAVQHTHVSNQHLQDQENNTLYLAADKSNCGLNKTFGIFNKWENVDDLILTEKGNKNRSEWEFPTALHGNSISHHGDNITIPSGKFKSVGRGQEFVINANENAKNWAIHFINNHIE